MSIPLLNKAHVYTQVIKFRQVLTKRPLTPNSGGTRVLKVPQVPPGTPKVGGHGGRGEVTGAGDERGHCETQTKTDKTCVYTVSLSLFNHFRAYKNPQTLFMQTVMNLGVGWVEERNPTTKTPVLLGYAMLHPTYIYFYFSRVTEKGY